MTVSSVSTFLDVAQSSRGPRSAAVDASSDATAQAAGVLNVINGGATTFHDIAAGSGLGPGETIDALSYLHKAELVTIAESDGIVSATLTSSARAALTAG
jgi:hypothetical protein